MPDDPVSHKIDFLRTQLQTNINGFRNLRAVSKRKAFVLRMSVVLLGALTTLLLGLKSNPLFESYENEISAAALLCSATVPILSAWDAFFDYRWLWVRYTSAQQTLYGVLDDLEFEMGAGPISDARLEELYKRFRAALEETNSAWRDRRNRMEAGPEGNRAGAT